jgi:Na+/melibiose symporter-like transporter
MDKTKLNYKTTITIGFAFFGILMIWQIYNTYCPTFLTELLIKQHPTTSSIDWQYLVGFIMALDNVFAIFMLPLFGQLSDKTHTRLGKRMPYIIIGSFLTIIITPLIPLFYVYNNFLGVMISMLLLIVFMNIYRNPAVSLMPDLTPKHLQTKANGITDLIGYIGAIIAGLIAMMLPLAKLEDSHIALVSNSKLATILPFIISALVMLVILLVLIFKVKENALQVNNDKEEVTVSNTKLSKSEKKQLIKMLLAIFFWYAAFNAVETFWTNFNIYYLNLNTSGASLSVNILAVISLFVFVPVANLATKIGKKKVILGGCAVLLLALVLLNVLTPTTVHNSLPIYTYGLFGLAGIGWSSINCCSYPFVVSFANKDNVGKLTGLYYTFVMVAQSLTPIAIGALFMSSLGWGILFKYASVIMALALVMVLLVKDSKESN